MFLTTQSDISKSAPRELTLFSIYLMATPRMGQSPVTGGCVPVESFAKLAVVLILLFNLFDES
jgi:hypothetical protein